MTGDPIIDVCLYIVAITMTAALVLAVGLLLSAVIMLTGSSMPGRVPPPRGGLHPTEPAPRPRGPLANPLNQSARRNPAPSGGSSVQLPENERPDPMPAPPHRSGMPIKWTDI